MKLTVECGGLCIARGAISLKSPAQVNDLAAFLIADDLTGACDAAAPFAGRGLRTQVILDREQMPQADVIACHTDSRDVAVETARKRVRSAIELSNQRESHLLFKKIDSAFRGNSVDEVRACLDFLPHKFAILAPAFPTLGRRIRAGRVIVEDFASHSMLDLPSQLRDRGMEFRIMEPVSTAADEPLSEQITRANEDGLRLILCDAEVQQDLDAIVRAGLRSELDLVWLGSAGLAHSLACAESVFHRETPWVPTKNIGAVVFCIGSDHPVTLAQVRYLKQAVAVTEVFLGPAAGDEICLALRNTTDVLLRIDRNRGNFGQHYLRSIRDVFRAFTGQHINKLVLSGGDTAAMICDALEAQAIELRNELLPGIPCGVIRGGAADGLTVITKSGGFGAEDVLVRVAHFFGGEARTKL
jgi:D-threonate/D-erythronate kinase